MGLSPQQQEILDKVRSQGQGADQKQAQIEQNASTAGSQLGRTVFQGLTFGWSDEAEAAIRAAIPGLDDRSYAEVRDEIRAKVNAYKEGNPGKAMTAEVVGGLIPSVIAMFIPGAQGVAAHGLGRTALIAGGQGLVYGMGTSEGDTAGEVIGDGLTGALTSAGVGAGLWVAGKGIKGISGAVYDTVKNKLGVKHSTAVQAELNRLVEDAGKSVDEVVADIANGRIIASNPALIAAVKHIVNQGGESGKLALEKAKSAASSSKQSAIKEMQDILAPGAKGDNILRSVQKTEDELLDLERKAYSDIYNKYGEVTPEVAQTIEVIVQRYPRLALELNKMYQESGSLIPLFQKQASGELKMMRMPSLEDAEKVYRTMRETTTKLFNAKSGQRAQGLGDLTKGYKTLLDDTFGGLKEVRDKAAVFRQGSDAFKEGRAWFGAKKNTEELDVYLDDLMQKDPYTAQAFLNGFLTTAKNQIRATGSTLSQMADSDKNLGSLLSIVLERTGRQSKELVNKLGLAGDLNDVYSKMPTMAGSPTAALQQSARKEGRSVTATDIMEGNTITNVMRVLGSFVGAKAPQLSPEQRTQVVKILYSTDPDAVRNALVDENAMIKLAQMIEEITGTAVKISSTPLKQQATQAAMSTDFGQVLGQAGAGIQAGLLAQ